ncbi:6-phospho-3-hexuloisomerase [Scopulibacillus darangshiensis]|uniref:6-phospho-3-hexuloisomerase n=1 Tax=Scopulibacillus darangshiensis TaxID=442528 RepID=A0A4R2NLH2_9BACL|nr:6-phospho-3-hexuloisomerase [Scopulibacillus darangshiensis]TCP22125.1 6-phospho-3-hexuloisomerase [Scopulibacillus darangshiensis]
MMAIQTIISEIQTVLQKVDEEAIRRFAENLAAGKRIFVIGEGRSGLMAKSFAMRLMHLGAVVFVVGETITPSIQKNDILVAVSGSGKTKQVVWTAEKAKELGSYIIGVTTNPESPLGQKVDEMVHVSAATKYRSDGEAESIQPLGSLFDQCVHVLFDTICLHYASLTENGNDAAFKRHSNLE